ncbi:MAG: glycoside hydrolase family 95 protein, partial [Pedosphaera parvula]|nr:glycoside hydrolase family 95 protein [Pedosphaera parvula]
MFSLLRCLRSTAMLSLLAAVSIHANASESPLRAWYQLPAAKWEEAIPLGNGRLGAMVFGGIASEHLQLNESTLYSGFPGYRDVRLSITNDFATVTNLIAQRRFAEADRLVTEKWLGGAQACYQPLGDLFLDFDHGATASNYVRELDLGSAVCRVRYEIDGATFTRELFASHPDEVIAVRLIASRPGSLNFRARFTSLHPTASLQTDAAKGEL